MFMKDQYHFVTETSTVFKKTAYMITYEFIMIYVSFYLNVPILKLTDILVLMLVLIC